MNQSEYTHLEFSVRSVRTGVYDLHFERRGECTHVDAAIYSRSCLRWSPEWNIPRMFPFRQLYMAGRQAGIFVCVSGIFGRLVVPVLAGMEHTMYVAIPAATHGPPPGGKFRRCRRDFWTSGRACFSRNATYLVCSIPATNEDTTYCNCI